MPRQTPYKREWRSASHEDQQAMAMELLHMGLGGRLVFRGDQSPLFRTGDVVEPRYRDLYFSRAKRIVAGEPWQKVFRVKEGAQ